MLRLLDHQVVGPKGELLGNVDDLVLRQVGDGLEVVAFMSGPAGLARRQGGRGGRWLHAVWTRLHPREHPRPVVVPLREVTKVGSALEVSAAAAEVLARSEGFELWLRQHVVGRLPGAREAEPAARVAPAEHRKPLSEAYLLQEGDHTTSELVGSRVSFGDRDLGAVIEVLAAPRGRGGGPWGRLVLTDVVCSPRTLGAELGYTMSPQGPRLVELAMRSWHRHDRRVDLRHVDIAWDDRHLEVSTSARLWHPREG
ncbi:hypothetical protein [Phycicoccus sp. 3266]|uniref:hypothetical protein n=1 Tax=Phycicoccus sp. 3266 TaxID=2817751 RepID=UPI00285E68FA|nr:hypothetical protein [Phycicoccus sp. 3266]MDR6864757.1 sporulation protein YlmC with PRC-barrel domain [Phycicoccus sp. 3266]